MSPVAIFLWLVSSAPVAQAVELAPLRATVWIRAGDRAVGTGWVVDRERHWIITARHVLADREQVEVFFLDHHDGRAITDRNHYLSERADLRKRGRLSTGTVVGKNDNADLALLHVDKMPNEVPALSLSSAAAQAGASCFAIGHRHDAELLWGRTAATVRQIGRLGEGYFWAGRRIGCDLPLLLVQSPVEAGESGAALVDNAGKVVGVVSAISNRTPGLAFAIDASAIRKLLDEIGGQRSPVPAPSRLDRRPDVDAVMHGSLWVRPQATEGRAAGALIDRERRLVLTTASAVGKEDLVDVVAPKWDKDRLVAEASEYRDLLALRLSGHCVQGVVLARDPVRDLAVIQLDDAPIRRGELPASLKEIPLSAGVKPGERVSALSHPTGEELLWLFAQGTVRSVGKVTLRRDGGDDSAKIVSGLYQLPHQGTASGGPIVDGQGKLVGILAAREGARQELAYAATPDEIREVLKACRPLWKPASNAEFYERARYLSGRGRTKSAIYQVRVDASFGPRDTLIAAYAAKMRAEYGDASVARQLMDDIEAKLKRSPEVDALLAAASLALGDRVRARRFVDAALKADPKLPGALLSRAALRSGKEARSDVDTALTLDPNCARAYVLRALLRDASEGEYQEKTLADLTRAVELEPYEVATRAHRAAAFLANKEYKKAASDFARLSEIEPLKSPWRIDLANALFLAGDRPAAARQYAAAVRVNPGCQSNVLVGIRKNGGFLQEDNSADAERVGDWYIAAVRELHPWLDERSRKLVAEVLSRATDETDVHKRMMLIERAINEIAESTDRPRK